MMYGFGDDRQPLARSVELMEDLVIDYVHQLLQRAQVACETRTQQQGRKKAAANAARVHERDLIFALRKDPRRKQRVEELLKVYDELIRTREGQDTARDLDDLENV